MKRGSILFLITSVAACAGAVPDTEQPEAASSAPSTPVSGKADQLRPVEDSGCTADADCPFGAACYDGACQRVRCHSTAECAAHEVCAQDKCTIAWCDVTQNCADGEACVAGKCVAAPRGCIDSLDCDADQSCVMSTCVDPSCASDSDCSESVCVGGTCRQLGCELDRDCAAVEVCRDQLCTLVGG